MPGHLGHEQVTVQNLTVVDVNVRENYLLVKGSIPGPNKSYVVVKQAVKNLPNKAEIKLVNFKDEIRKNELLEEAKKYGAELDINMSVEQMEELINQAQAAKEQEEQAKKDEGGDK